MRSSTSSLTSRIGAHAEVARLSVAVASNPTAGRPARGCVPSRLRTASSTTGCSWFLMRNTPSMRSRPSPWSRTDVLSKRMYGYVAASKNSGPRSTSIQLGHVRGQAFHGHAQRADKRPARRVVAQHALDAPACAVGLENPKWLQLTTTSVCSGSIW
ncbi:hypothetical protein AD428_23205 [Achromobacter sp. DMS1]|nr:hypothetical protein AD428_23205 [Achromobacter sp. DMS1]